MVKNLSIEPSQYQNKKVYQITTDTDNIVLYHENNEWKQDDSHKLKPEWIAQIGEAISAIEKVASLPNI